jgi:protein-tyrosine phosphatase
MNAFDSTGISVLAFQYGEEGLGLPEMSKVWEGLFVGGRNDAERLYFSNLHNIITVISLCEKPVICRNPLLVYIHIPIGDCWPPSLGQFHIFINAVADNIRLGPLLIHCGSGVSRAPIMAAAWMHVSGYKNIDRALEEVAGVRPIIDPSDILLESVKEILQSEEIRYGSVSPEPEERQN